MPKTSGSKPTILYQRTSRVTAIWTTFVYVPGASRAMANMLCDQEFNKIARQIHGE